MSDFQYLTVKHDPERRLWITLRASHAAPPENILLLEELSTVLLSTAQDSAVHSIIIATESTGATGAPTATPPAPAEFLPQLASMIKLTQTVGQQLRALDIPSVVLLKHPVSMHEMSLAMAASYCISSNDKHTQLAFREVNHGLHPNMINTQQAIRRMGIADAMNYLLTGTVLSATQAVEKGLIDACVAATELHVAAIDFLGRKPALKPTSLGSRLGALAPLRNIRLNPVLHDKARQIGKQAHYPAPYALLRLWEQHGLKNTTGVQHAYLDSIQRLSQTQQALHLSRIANLTSQLRQTDNKRPESTINRIYLIGVGEITCNIATSLLPRGAKVILCNRRRDLAAQTLTQIKQALSSTFSSDKNQLDHMLHNLSHDVDGKAIGDADLILLIDDLNLADSQELFAELEEKAHANAILAVQSNTLELDNIAAALLNPGRLLGMHFCQQALGIKLVELAFSQATDKQLLNEVQQWLRQLGKMTLTTHSNPGQLVDRILLHYVLQGIRLHQQGVPQAYIDRAGQHCGMSEGPLELADRLDLDYCLRLAEVLQKANKNIEIPYSLSDKVRAGKLGIKSGSGFYRYRNGNRLKTERILWDGSETALQEKLVGQICEEAAACLEEGLLENPDLIDAGMIFGAGFAPYPGGPLYQQRAVMP